MSTGTSCHFSHMLQVSKNLLEVRFYTINVHYQGQTAPRGQSFDVNRYVLSLHSFVASLKKKFPVKSDFIHFFFHDLIHVAPAQGQRDPRGLNFGVNRKALSLFPFVASFKEISFKSDFIQLFSSFNTCL